MKFNRLVLCLICTGILAGCSSSNQPSQNGSLSQTPVSLQPSKQTLNENSKTSDEMIALLNQSGWQAEAAGSDLVDVWQKMPPEAFITAQTADGSVLMAGYFQNTDQAKKAYELLCDNTAPQMEKQNGTNFQQMTVNFDQNEGFATFRQIGKVVMGIWYNTVESQGPSLAILDQFQQDDSASR